MTEAGNSFGRGSQIEPRFVLATERYVDPVGEPQPHAAAETLHVVRAAWNELRATCPAYYIGATIFGSSIKGRFTNRDRYDGHSSDIDMMLFVDPALHAAAPVKDFQAKAFLDGWLAKHTRTDRFGWPLHEVHLTGVGNYESVDLSPESIDEVLARMIEAYNEDDREDRTFFVSHKSIFGPFLLRLGNGELPVYRRYILDAIEREAGTTNPDELWLGVARQVYRFEECKVRSTGKPATIFLPRTVAAARRYYHLD